MKKTIVKAALEEVEEYQNYGGWLIEYQFGGTLDKNIKHDTYIKCCARLGDLEEHKGAALLFLDKADAVQAFKSAEIGKALISLMLHDDIPKMKYFDEDDYTIID